MMQPGQSLLDRTIARLTAQRAYLEAATARLAGREGPVLEIGLGKGRTYDHLRRLLPGRDILCFDRTLHALPQATPDPAHLVLGEFFQTLAEARDRLEGRAVLAHADFGTQDPEADAAQARWLGPMIDRLMAPGGLIVADRWLDVPRWTGLAGPPAPWPYHLWQVAEGPG